MSLKNIFAKLTSEGFGDVQCDVEALLKTGNHFNEAVIIIRKVAGVVGPLQASSTVKLDTQSVKNVSKLCSKAIMRDKVGDVIEMDGKLLRAMYHICRFLYDLGDCRTFLDTIETFLPILESMATVDDPKDLVVLGAFVSIVFNSFKKFENHFSKYRNEDSSINQLWTTILRLSSLARTDLHLLFNLAHNIILFSCKKVCIGKEVLKLQDDIVLSLNQFFVKEKKNNIQDQNMDKMFQTSVFAVVQFFQTALPDYEKAFSVLKDMFKILYATFPANSTEGKALNVITKIISPFLISFQTDPLMKVSCEELTDAMAFLVKTVQEFQPVPQSLEFAAYAVQTLLVKLKGYWATNIEKAKSIFHVSLMPVLDKLFSKLIMILKKSCCAVCVNSSGQQCPLKADVPGANYLMMVLIFLVTRVLDWKEDDQPVLLEVCQHCFQQCNELLQIAVKNKCFLTTDMTFNLCEHTYVAALKCSSPDSSLKLLEKSKDLYLSVCNTTEEAYLPRKSIIKSIMKLLAKTLSKTESTYTACVATALTVVFDHADYQEDKALMMLWRDLISREPNSAITLYTLLKNKQTVKELYANYDERTVDWIHLFFWEMTSLKTYGKLKLSYVMKIWKTGEKLKLSPLQEIEAAALLLKAVFSCDDIASIEKFLRTFKSEKYHDLLKAISSQDCPVALCGLAELSYFRCVLSYKIHKQLSEEVVKDEKTIEPLPKVILSTADVVDPNDICNMIPAYPNLTVSKEEPLINILDTAVSYWDKSLKKGLEASQLSSRAIKTSSEYLTETALFYRLFGHQLKEKRAWEVCWSFGQRVKNDSLELKAISGLMDLSCCEPKLIMRGHNIAANLSKGSSEEAVLHMFKNSCIVHYFLTEKRDEAVALLKDILQANESYTWYYARSLFLSAKYSCGSLIDSRYSNISKTARYSLKRVTQLVDLQTRNRCPSIADTHALADLMISISNWLGYYYMKVMLPREARCFLKNELLMAQKMGLPVRTAECLSLLAKVDLLVQKVDESIVKVEGMKHILEVRGAEESKDDDVHVYQDEEDDKCLRFPKNDLSPLGASPTLQVERFNMPSFLSHKSSCSCYHCSHILLQKLWMNIGYIQACGYTSMLEVKPARNYFSNSIRLAEKSRYKQDKLLNGCEGHSSLLEDVFRTEASIRLKYADLLSLYSKDHDACRVNKTAFTSLNKIRPSDSLLLTEATEQKINFIDITVPNVESQKHEARQLEISNSNANMSTPNANVSKTLSALTVKTPNQNGSSGSRSPLKAISPVSAIAIKDKVFIKPRGILAPKLHFSESDEEDSGTGATGPELVGTKGLRNRQVARRHEAAGKSLVPRKEKVFAKPSGIQAPIFTLSSSDEENSSDKPVVCNNKTVKSRMATRGKKYMDSKLGSSSAVKVNVISPSESDDEIEIIAERLEKLGPKKKLEGTSKTRTGTANAAKSECKIPVWRPTRSRKFN